MPLNLHRSGDGADPLVLSVPHFNDDVVGLALCELVATNLTGREDSSLHGSVQAAELSPSSSRASWTPSWMSK
jgi:hypothetical protein